MKRKLTPSQAIYEERCDALAQATPDLQHLMQRAEEQRKRFYAKLLTLQFTIATDLSQVAKDPTTYGSDGLKQLTEYLGMPTKERDEFLLLAASYTAHDIETLGQISFMNGRRMTMEFLILLAEVEDRGERTDLANQMLREAWNLRQLRKELDRRLAVPTIVRDLVRYAGTDQPVARLKSAQEALRVLRCPSPSDPLLYIARQFLNWWGSPSRAGDRGSPMSMTIVNSAAPWVAQSRVVVDNTPGFEGLVIWKNDTWNFECLVTTDERCEIQEYVQQNYRQPA